MNTQSHRPPADSQPFSGKGVIVGIDWADREHAVCLIDPHGRTTLETLPQSPEAIDEWAGKLAGRFPGQMGANNVITERNEGLIWALTAFDLRLSADSSDPLIPTDRRVARFSAFRVLPSARKYLLPSAKQAPE